MGRDCNRGDVSAAGLCRALRRAAARAPPLTQRVQFYRMSVLPPGHPPPGHRQPPGSPPASPQMFDHRTVACSAVGRSMHQMHRCFRRNGEVPIKAANGGTALKRAATTRSAPNDPKVARLRKRSCLEMAPRAVRGQTYRLHPGSGLRATWSGAVMPRLIEP